MNTTENARYREAAEYNTTVEEAQKAAGIVTPAYCLAYELRQYVAAYSQQVYSRENRDEEGPELLSKEHPDYPQRLADRKEEGERQLREIYALHGQELADEWAAARSDTLDERLLLACFLKESAHRLIDGYTRYLTGVGTGRILPGSVGSVGFIFRISGSHIRPVETFASRLSHMQERDKTGDPGYGLSYSSGKYAELDRALTAAGAGAAELAHFYRLLEAFQAAEQVPTGTTVPAGAAVTLGQLSLQQVALLYTYQNKGIPKAAADSIARQHGHESGAKLYGHYTTVSQRAGRVGDDITGQKLAPMIKNITAVIPHLSGAQQQQAENELKTLQARKETPV